MSNRSFSSSKKTQFLSKLPTSSVESSEIAKRCKFNFSYFVEDQLAGQSFADWNNGQGPSSLYGLLDKVRQFSREPLDYWNNEKVGKQNILEIYGAFPKTSKTEFSHPPSVPHDVQWARFRLAAKVRLIGFVLPKESHNVDNCKAKKVEYLLDCNTFYVVFLDKDHKFYKTEKP